MDSVAFHFRHGNSSVDFAKRARLLASMAQKLNELASKQALAVVLLNQMTTKISTGRAPAGGGGGSSRLVPALGESWAHAATHRVQLYWAPPTLVAHASSSSSTGGVAAAYANAERVATFIKSSCRPSDVEARYTVTELGVRDVKRPRATPTTQLRHAHQEGGAEEKRARHSA
jgi:RAD51-like protein 2